LKISKPRVAIFSDLHLGVHTNSSDWHNYAIEWAHWFKEECKRKNIKDIIFCGDWHHNRSEISVNTLQVSADILDILCDFNIIAITGNHDIYYKHRTDVNSLSIFKKRKNVTILDRHDTIEAFDRTITFCPWNTKVKDIPEAKLIADYLMYQKRVAQVESWLKSADNNDRVKGFVNSNGTITGRMTHNSPNLAQVPSSNSPYGADCRSCWTVPKQHKLVGIDASGLELRMLAHYLNDEDYTNEIVNGDVHTANQRSAGLESRSQAKTFIYALLYGAGNEKLGSKLDNEDVASRDILNI